MKETEETLERSRKVMEENNNKPGPSMEDLNTIAEQSKTQVKEDQKFVNETPKPTEYQKRLIAQWHESGHTGPAPFASDGSQLFWLNRQQRRARASIARKNRK